MNIYLYFTTAYTARDFVCPWYRGYFMYKNKILIFRNWFDLDRKRTFEFSVSWSPAHLITHEREWLCPKIPLKKLQILLTGAATNPWIRFESDDSFIKFEIGTIWYSLVQFYSTFLLQILHFLSLSVFSGQNLFNLRLHLQYSTFNSKLQLYLNLKL